MRKQSRTIVRGLSAAGIMLPLLLSAACSSGSSPTTTNAANNAGAAQGAAAPSANAAAQGNAGASAGADNMGNDGGQGASVTISEKMGPPDHYSFTPATVKVPMGQALSIVNKSDEEHQLTCTPNPGVSMDMLTVAKAGTQSVTFSKAGTYKCFSKTHKAAKITITVS